MKKIGENILVPLQSALKFVAVAAPPPRKHRYSKYTVSCFCISDLFHKLLQFYGSFVVRAVIYIKPTEVVCIRNQYE